MVWSCSELNQTYRTYPISFSRVKSFSLKVHYSKQPIDINFKEMKPKALFLNAFGNLFEKKPFTFIF
jgi:hypothetical protein